MLEINLESKEHHVTIIKSANPLIVPNTFGCTCGWQGKTWSVDTLGYIVEAPDGYKNHLIDVILAQLGIETSISGWPK